MGSNYKLNRELEIIERSIDRLRNLQIPINRIDQLKDINLFAQVILDNVNSIKEEISLKLIVDEAKNFRCAIPTPSK